MSFLNNRRWVCASLMLLVVGIAGAEADDYVNFESPQTRPIALSPDGRWLYAVNTSDNRVSVFDTHRLSRVRELAVGLEPVGLAHRPNTDEVWVVNHLSDSVDILGFRRDPRVGRAARAEIIATIPVGDEPASIAFSADGQRAFVTLSQPDQLAVIDAGQRLVIELSSLATAPYFNGQDPRAVVFDPASSRVFVTLFESGNRTRGAGPAPGQPIDGVGTIVLDPALDDFDLFALDPATGIVDRVEAIGTILTNLRLSPDGSKIYVTGWDARNLVRTVEELDGRPVTNLLTVVDRATMEIIDRIDLDAPTYSPEHAVAQPMDLEFDAAGRLWLAAQGNDQVVVLDTDGRQIDRLPTGQGPRGLAFDPVSQRLYVFNRLSRDITVIDTVTRSVVATLDIGHDPAPLGVREGRRFLYDAGRSRDGSQACVACHPDGHQDNIVWDLSDVTDPKGPMMTQSLRGLRGNAPYHWRGERETLLDFNGAFEDLFAGHRLSDADNQQMAAYLESIEYPPNPVRRLDGALSSQLAECGRQLFEGAESPDACEPLQAGERRFLFPCVACHRLPDGTNNQIIGRNVLRTHEDMEVTQLRGLTDKVATMHDGRTRTVVDLLSQSPPFPPFPESDKRAMQQFVMEFSSGQPAAVGVERTLTESACSDGNPAAAVAGTLDELARQSVAGRVDLVAFGRIKNLPPVQLLFDPVQDTFLLDRLSPAAMTRDELVALACQGQASLTFTAWPVGTGVRSRDRDQDGLLNGVERSSGTDPGSRDTDADGLEDGEEVVLGTSARHADTDRDGIDDGRERFDGTDPLDPGSGLRFVQLVMSEGIVELHWSTVFGRRYTVGSLQLDRPIGPADQFEELFTTPDPESEFPSGTESFSDAVDVAPGEIRFYRVETLPAPD